MHKVVFWVLCVGGIENYCLDFLPFVFIRREDANLDSSGDFEGGNIGR